MRVIASLLLWAWAALSAAVLFWPFALTFLVTVPLDPRRRAVHSFAAWWACSLHALSPLWTLDVEGMSHYRTDRAYVLAANHVSTADILILFALRRQFRWVAKAELFNVPFVGWAMRMCRYIPIRRGDPNSRAAMMSAAVAQLRSGNSVAMFPEGTRSPAGELSPFKMGAFVMACEADVPVLPILLHGTGAVLPKNAWITGLQQHGRPLMRVLAPLSPADFDHDPGRLMAATQARLSRELAALVDERGM